MLLLTTFFLLFIGGWFVEKREESPLPLLGVVKQEFKDECRDESKDKPKDVQDDKPVPQKPKPKEKAPVVKPAPPKKQHISRGLPSRATGRFKTYMDYRTITNKATKQWEMQQEATTDSTGLRIHNGRYMVAVGSYYAKQVGVELRITLDSGKTFTAVVGDLKQDRHTDSRNQFVPANGNIVEFIVDVNKLPATARRLGDVSPLGLEGKVAKIEIAK